MEKNTIPFWTIWKRSGKYAQRMTIFISSLTNRQIQRGLKKHLGVVHPVYENIYHLLAHENVAHVCALNSSVLYEAEYFGKKTTFLYNRTFGEGKIGIYGDYFTSAFWGEILSPLFETIGGDLALDFMPSRLRRSLHDFWSYNEIGDAIVLKDIVKSKVKYFLAKYIR